MFYVYILLIIFFFLYSGYLRGHGLKYQTTLFSNGMFSSIYGASMSHNDVGVLNMSMLTTYMENILYPNHVMAGGLLPALYGDAIFMHLNYATILAKYDLVGNAEVDNLIRKLNRRMSGIRQSIELMYGQLFNLFRLLQTKWQIKILLWRIIWELCLFYFKLLHVP